MSHEGEKFMGSSIVICKTCNGAAKRTRTFDLETSMMSEISNGGSVEEECPDCNGSGRWVVMMYRKPFGSSHTIAK